MSDAMHAVDSDAALLAGLKLLDALSAKAVAELARLAHREKFARGLDPFQLHDWSGRVVWLLRGELKVDEVRGGMRVLVGGCERALLPLWRGNGPPPRAKAITDVELISFDENDLDILVTWNEMVADSQPGDGGGVDWRAKGGLLLAGNPARSVFAALPPAHIAGLLARFVPVEVRRNEEIVRQGEAGDCYYVIDSGRARVTRQVAGGEVELAELMPGDAFGEEALIQGALRNATVRMISDGTLLKLAKADFVALLQEPLLHRISPREARARVDDGAQWLDVRFPAEYQYDGLPGARNVPLGELRQAMSGLDVTRDYIVYCQSGRRSSAAAFLLAQRGFRVWLLDGGLRAMLAESDAGERGATPSVGFTRGS